MKRMQTRRLSRGSAIATLSTSTLTSRKLAYPSKALNARRCFIKINSTILGVTASARSTIHDTGTPSRSLNRSVTLHRLAQALPSLAIRVLPIPLPANRTYPPSRVSGELFRFKESRRGHQVRRHRDQDPRSLVVVGTGCSVRIPVFGGYLRFFGSRVLL